MGGVCCRRAGSRMRIVSMARRAATCAVLASMCLLAACGSVPKGSRSSNSLACMSRAMYFESNRSSDEGMLAVGTVVMNRVDSSEFPNTVCAVVGQKNQFAPGVLSRAMKEDRSKARAERAARAVLKGQRHRGVRKAMYFHTAGRTYRYKNMHYVLVAGGNAFYTRKAKAGHSYIPRHRIARAGQKTKIEAPRGFARAVIAAPGRLLAAAPIRRKAPAGPGDPSIEELILASSGW